MSVKTYRQLMWNAIRVLKRFDVPTLRSVCILQKTNKPVDTKYIVDYCGLLVRGGYLVKPKTEYILKKCTGNKSIVPVKDENKKIRSLYDPNIMEYVPLASKATNREILENIMKQKNVFTMNDIAKHTTTKHLAKYYVHTFIKKGKVVINQNLKGYNDHQIAEYKYIGGKDDL